MEFTVMDARMMTFPPETFDAVIDKAVFDTIVCGDDNFNNGTALLLDCYRVLKPGGAFVLISHGAPEVRRPYLLFDQERLRWQIKVSKVVKSSFRDELAQGPQY